MTEPEYTSSRFDQDRVARLGGEHGGHVAVEEGLHGKTQAGKDAAVDDAGVIRLESHVLPLAAGQTGLTFSDIQRNLVYDAVFQISEMATTTLQKSLRIPRETAEAVEQLAEASERDFSSMANDLLAEGVKMRRAPGIVFADGPSGRRARIAGTGVDVWEVIASYRSVDRSMDRLREAYHWLSAAQLRAALGYYAAYPSEIDQQIARNDRWTKSELARQYPSLDADLG